MPQEKSIFQLNISSSFKGKGNFCYKKGRKVIEISFQKTNIAAIGYDLFWLAVDEFIITELRSNIEMEVQTKALFSYK